MMMAAAGCSGTSALSGMDGPAGAAVSSATHTPSGTDSPQEAAGSYADRLFDSSFVHTIDVIMPEEDRADQLANPTEKTKYKADIVIDGEEFKDISIKTKGNSSLFFTAMAGMDKFSYGIDFGKFNEGQTYYGLDDLNLQNNISDTTSMREFMSYWLFNKMGVDAPLASYAWLTINGEDQGLFTVLEDVEESFLDRTKDGKGTIYKPEEGELGLTDEEMDSVLAGNSAAHNNGGGADLKYKDDKEESYPDIFENAKTDDDEETRARVIRALKALSEGENLEEYLDTDEIIKYFAVHDYLVNHDSYTGPMLHNYFLYEKDGRLAMLPWDYDIACGTFPADGRTDSVADSTEVVNTGIDSPLGGIADEERPMWNWILSDENYLEKYHEMLSEVAEVINSKAYEKEAERVRGLILPYIEKDPKAFYKKDDFAKAFETLLRFTELRAESVQKQLDGQLAARSELQAQEDKVDASGISIMDMGSAMELLQ